MKRLTKFGLPLVIAALFLTGCPKQENPEPSDTIMGNRNSGASHSGYPDWIDNDQIHNEPRSGGSSYSEDAPLPRRSNTTLVNTNTNSTKSNDPASTQSNQIDIIYFGYDEYSIQAEERPKLESVAQYLNSHPSSHVIAEGNTSWRGTTQYNLGLGDKRANAVKAYLEQLGISPNRIEVLSLGELHATSNLGRTDAQARKERNVRVLLVN